MLLFDGAFGLIMLGLWLFCLIDVITTDSALCRNLPKPLWILIVLVLPDVGSLLWLVAGRTWASATPKSLPYKGNTGPLASRDRPGRGRPGNPDDDEEFLRGLRERAEQQRREYRLRNERDGQSDQPDR